MNKKIILSLLFALFTSVTSANERQHTIEVVGGKVTKLTVADLEKKFSKLNAIKTSLQNEPVQNFEGVSLADLVAAYASEGSTKVKVIATNNYEQILTKKDIEEWGALLAFKSDGKSISTKTRGTFRVVYDYEKYKSNKAVLVILETNSVWQVNKIEFLK